jgi:hypothetical protein
MRTQSRQSTFLVAGMVAQASSLPITVTVIDSQAGSLRHYGGQWHDAAYHEKAP